MATQAPIRDGLFFLKPDTHTATADEHQLVQKCKNLYILARDYKRVRYQNWVRNYRLVNNRLGSTQSSWMPQPRDSEIYPVLSSMVAHMTDQNVALDFVPACDPNTSQYYLQTQLCDDLSAVMYSTWLTEGYDAQIGLVLWDAFLYGMGVLKIGWDASLSGGQGNAILRRTDPWRFYTDPDASSFLDSEFFIEVSRMSYSELERRFPERCEMVKGGGDFIDEKPNLFNAETPSHRQANIGTLPSAGQYPGTTPLVQGRYNRGGQHRNQTNTLHTLYEFWVRENKRYTTKTKSEDGTEQSRIRVRDRWRVIVICDENVMMDEFADDLWSHGQPPYERYAFDDIGEMYGISLVDHLAYPQIYINRLLTSMQHNTELTGNPVLVESENSGTTRVGITNKPGTRLSVRGPNMQMTKPEWLVPPSMPPAAMELVQFWINRIENTSGLSAFQRGSIPSQRTAEGTATMAQEAAFVRVRAAIRNLEYTLQSAGLKLSDLIVDNYTQPRMVAILGQEGANSARMLAGRHFWVPGPSGNTPMKYVLQVRAGASTPTSRQARVAEAETLLALGAVDDQYVLEAHQVRNIPDVLQRKYFKLQNGLMGAPGARQRAGRSS